MHNTTGNWLFRALSIILCCGSCSVASSQNVGAWTITSPGNSIQLVGVDSVTSTTLRFTLRNVTLKEIIYFVAVAPNGNMTGIDGFSIGKAAILPGATGSVVFGLRDFSHNNIPMISKVSITAIVYADGTREGEKLQLDEIEDEMLGAALETRRDADILAASQDSAGLNRTNDVVTKIGHGVPSSGRDAVAMESGVVLPGVSQDYVTSRLTRHSSGFQIGVSRAKDMILRDVGKALTVSAATSTGSGRSYSTADNGQISSPSELASKYKILSDKQAQYIALLSGATNAQ